MLQTLRRLPLFSHFGNVNQKIPAMAQDFPESKYDYRPGLDVRSFAKVILHMVRANAPTRARRTKQTNRKRRP